MTIISGVVSDENVQQVTGQIFVGQAILVAYKIGLFDSLSTSALSINDLSKELNLTNRAVQALLSCCASLNFVENINNKFQLTELGHAFLNKKSKMYYGGVFDLLIDQNEIMNFEKIEKAICTNNPQVDEGKDIFSDLDGLGGTNDFVQSIHQKAIAPAFSWTNLFKLNDYKKFVDIGGGSGIHTIAACINNPMIQGTVCDRKSVLPFTKKYVREFDLEDRIELCQLDMWQDPIPNGDVIFLGDIFHDWTYDKCLQLAKKCYEALSDNGIIILHEMLFNREKTGPPLTAAYNMKMMMWTEGQQYSFQELQEILSKVGFKDISCQTTLGNWSIVVGKKSPT